MDDRISSDSKFWAEIMELKLPDDPPIKAVVDHLYADLRTMAHQIMWQEGGPRTIQPTALLHEAYERLQRAAHPIQWRSAEHAMRLFSRTMRRVLIDEALKRKALKRDGSRVAPAWIVFRDRSQIELDVVLDIDLALQELRAHGDSGGRQADVLEMVLFSQAKQKDIADELGVSLRQVERDWSDGRYWLAKRLRP